MPDITPRSAELSDAMQAADEGSAGTTRRTADIAVRLAARWIRTEPAPAAGSLLAAIEALNLAIAEYVDADNATAAWIVTTAIATFDDTNPQPTDPTEIAVVAAAIALLREQEAWFLMHGHRV